jgi:truncated hemoglobin YjbI
MHWYVEFRDPVRPPGAEPTLYEWAGGLPALVKMTRLLYEKHVPADDLLAPLFAAMPPDLPQREAATMAEAFGGPARPEDGAGAQTRPDLTEEQRKRWVALATLAADDAVLPADPEFRAALGSYLEWSSRAGGPTPQWDWSPAGPPAEAPARAQGAEEDQPQVTLPGPDETVSFEAHIKPLFREHDRKSMTFAFDLWSREDVQAHAAGIAERLRNGTMPCDGAWPAEKIEVFQRWSETGFQP